MQNVKLIQKCYFKILLSQYYQKMKKYILEKLLKKWKQPQKKNNNSLWCNMAFLIDILNNLAN